MRFNLESQWDSLGEWVENEQNDLGVYTEAYLPEHGQVYKRRTVRQRLHWQIPEKSIEP